MSSFSLSFSIGYRIYVLLSYVPCPSMCLSFSDTALRGAWNSKDFFGYVHTVLHSSYPVRSYALWGCKGSQVMSPNRPTPCRSPKSYLGHARS